MVIDNFVFGAVAVILALLVGWVFLVWRATHDTREEVQRIAEQHSVISTDGRARALCRAVRQLRPNLQAGIDFLIKQDNITGPYIAEWDNSSPQPSVEELQTVLSGMTPGSQPGMDYAEKRRAEYPSIRDQLDAAFKARHGDEADQTAIDAQIHAVKRKYPKPESC